MWVIFDIWLVKLWRKIIPWKNIMDIWHISVLWRESLWLGGVNKCRIDFICASSYIIMLYQAIECYIIVRLEWWFKVCLIFSRNLPRLGVIQVWWIVSSEFHQIKIDNWEFLEHPPMRTTWLGSLINSSSSNLNWIDINNQKTMYAVCNLKTIHYSILSRVKHNTEFKRKKGESIM